MKLWILAPLLLLGACATGPWTDFYNDPHPASIPGDVRKFVFDAQGCNHFSGEDAYDAERAAFLKKNIDALCTGIKERYNKLAVKYAGNAEATALIADAWSVIK